MEDEESICLNCLYGCQPFGYYPIECLHSKQPKEMWEDIHKCKHYEPCPEPEPEPKPVYEPWQVIICNKKRQ